MRIGIGSGVSGLRREHVIVAAGVLLHHELQHALLLYLLVHVARGIVMQVHLYVLLAGYEAAQLALSEV